MRGDHVSVLLFLFGVLQKLFGDGLRVDSGRHEVVTLVAQHADDLRGQRLPCNLRPSFT